MVFAQRGGFGMRGRIMNPPYNGQFTFSRVSYGGGLQFFGRGSSAWNHDYPDADMNLPQILNAITSIQPNLNQSNILDLEDPEIFRNPILYMWEPGFWQVTDKGAENLRRHLHKGGFIVFDDFEAEQWANFEYQFRRVIPEAIFFEIESDHPVFHSFFSMDEIYLPHPSRNVTPSFQAVFEDNDPTRRIIALVFFNSDVAEYWEWSGRGRFGMDLTNDAYKLGVNFMVYALTH
jgi:hypothetical protein